MQSNMTASTTATFAPNLNFNSNQSLSFLQHQQPQQTPQIQQNFLNNSYINDMNPNILQSSLQTKDTTFTKIFVGGLPYHTTDESLGQFFKKFGNIEEAVVINDRQTGKSRGYGFVINFVFKFLKVFGSFNLIYLLEKVTMETRDAAEAAVLDPNPIIDGRKSNVNLAYLGVKSRIIAPTGKQSYKYIKIIEFSITLSLIYLLRYDSFSSQISVTNYTVCLRVIKLK